MTGRVAGQCLRLLRFVLCPRDSAVLTKNIQQQQQAASRQERASAASASTTALLSFSFSPSSCDVGVRDGVFGSPQPALAKVSRFLLHFRCLLDQLWIILDYLMPFWDTFQAAWDQLFFRHTRPELIVSSGNCLHQGSQLVLVS